MKFLKLHYRESGKAFLINTAVIAGVEVNGPADNGCVLTLTTVDEEGQQRYEQVRESFEEIEGLLIG